MASSAARSEPPLVVIVGPTASGKTSLAIDIALRYKGEVICADSRTVFREMNIGTAKPSLEEQRGVPHWGLDLTEPGERYTAAQWQAYARQKVADIRARGRLPIIVGGTGLYVDGLLFDYEYPAQPSSDERLKFEQMSGDELYKYCIQNNIELPINDKNRRHLIGVALRNGQKEQRRESIIDNTIVVGIATCRAALINRIALRTEQMFADGVVDEASRLGKKYGWESEAMTGNIYPLIRNYLEGDTTLYETKAAFCHRDWQLAKRQLTWLRRNPFILWHELSGAEHYLASQLASKATS